MALVAVTGNYRDWFLTYRNGEALIGTVPNEVYDCLVSDLAVNDFLIGTRAKVTATGATTSGVRTLTLQRMNSGTFIVQWPSASSVRMAR